MHQKLDPPAFFKATQNLKNKAKIITFLQLNLKWKEKHL